MVLDALEGAGGLHLTLWPSLHASFIKVASCGQRNGLPYTYKGKVWRTKEFLNFSPQFSTLFSWFLLFHYLSPCHFESPSYILDLTMATFTASMFWLYDRPSDLFLPFLPDASNEEMTVVANLSISLAITSFMGDLAYSRFYLGHRQRS